MYKKFTHRPLNNVIHPLSEKEARTNSPLLEVKQINLLLAIICHVFLLANNFLGEEISTLFPQGCDIHMCIGVSASLHAVRTRRVSGNPHNILFHPLPSF